MSFKIMPEPINDDKGTNAGDDAAANAAAAATANEGAGTGDGAGAGAGAGEETVTIKKSEWDKTTSDLENYKTGLIGKKVEERPLTPGDGAGDKGGEGAGTDAAAVNEAKTTEVATAAATKTLRDAAEKSAKKLFLKNHPEYLDDEAWVSLMANLTFKGGEVTHEDIMDRMDAALLEHKRSTGKLDEFLAEERARGIREGRIQETIESGAGTGGAGDRGAGDQAGSLSPKAQEMAEKMHVDPEKVRKVDTSKDTEILNP